MQWEDRSHAGFTQGIPWLPANPNYVFVNARAAVNDPGSVFHHYKALIELRHTTPVVVDGRFALLAADHDRLWAFTRSTDDDTLLVLANLSTEPLTLPVDGLPDRAGATLLLGTHGSGGSGDTLAPWESRVLRLA
jgi:oligo-1,6-glucosidase